MKSSELVEKGIEGHAPLSYDQRREVFARLKFADIERDADLSPGEVSIVTELIASVSSAKPTERTASVSGGCPRCGHSLSGVKLADQSQALYCDSCRVVVPQ